MEVLKFTSSPSDEGTLTMPVKTPVKSDSGMDNDPLVSQPISLVTTPIELVRPSLVCKENLTALLDSGCTRCLVSPSRVEKLGMQLR